MIQYAETLSMTPVTVPAELRTALQANFSTKQLAELTNFIAWENARARFNRGFDIEPDGYVQG